MLSDAILLQLFALTLQSLSALTKRIDTMATSFDDLRRELGEEHGIVLQALDIAGQAIALLDKLSGQVKGGISAADAAAAAAQLDADQQALVARLDALRNSITNADTGITSQPGSVTPAA